MPQTINVIQTAKKKKKYGQRTRSSNDSSRHCRAPAMAHRIVCRAGRSQRRSSYVAGASEQATVAHHSQHRRCNVPSVSDRSGTEIEYFQIIPTSASARHRGGDASKCYFHHRSRNGKDMTSPPISKQRRCEQRAARRTPGTRTWSQIAVVRQRRSRSARALITGPQSSPEATVSIGAVRAWCSSCSTRGQPGVACVVRGQANVSR